MGKRINRDEKILGKGFVVPTNDVVLLSRELLPTDLMRQPCWACELMQATKVTILSGVPMSGGNPLRLRACLSWSNTAGYLALRRRALGFCFKQFLKLLQICFPIL